MRSLLICLVLLVPLHAQAERLALVVGNSEYQRSTDLPQTSADAHAVAGRLQSLGFRLIGGKAHIDLTRGQMLRQIRTLGREAMEGDEVVFYFSGHGIGGTQTNFLLPINDFEIETKEDVPDLAVDVASIIDRLPKTGDGVNIFILDACRNNPLPNRAKSAFSQKGLVSVSKGSSNNVFLYAAEPGERAYVSTNGRSYFTDAFLSSVDTPGQDLTELIRKVRTRVAEDTSDKYPPQLPWIEGVSASPFFFRPGSSSSLTQTPILANDEGTALAQAISADTLAAYVEFRDRFAQSKNLDFVVTKIRELDPQFAPLEYHLQVIWEVIPGWTGGRGVSPRAVERRNCTISMIEDRTREKTTFNCDQISKARKDYHLFFDPGTGRTSINLNELPGKFTAGKGYEPGGNILGSTYGSVRPQTHTVVWSTQETIVGYSWLPNP